MQLSVSRLENFLVISGNDYGNGLLYVTSKHLHIKVHSVPRVGDMTILDQAFLSPVFVIFR